MADDLRDQLIETLDNAYDVDAPNWDAEVAALLPVVRAFAAQQLRDAVHDDAGLLARADALDPQDGDRG